MHSTGRPNIIGYHMASGVTQSGRIADDLIFLTDLLVSLPKLIQSLQEYGNLFFFQINLFKSSVLNNTVDNATALPLQYSFPHCWASESIHYF